MVFLGPWHAARMQKRGHHIKSWRKFRERTQEWLAEQIGVTRNYVSMIEKGKRRYDQPFLEAAAEALNCTPADLIERDPTAPEPIWRVWDEIPAEDREQAARVLAAFKKPRKAA